jgi:hypothetical protein
MNQRCEFARISDTFNFDRFANRWRFAERRIPKIKVNPSGGILDDSRFKFRQGARNDSPYKHALSIGRFLAAQPVDLLGGRENPGL